MRTLDPAAAGVLRNCGGAQAFPYSQGARFTLRSSLGSPRTPTSGGSVTAASMFGVNGQFSHPGGNSPDVPQRSILQRRQGWRSEGYRCARGVQFLNSLRPSPSGTGGGPGGAGPDKTQVEVSGHLRPGLAGT
jgi:hypothetical protein